MNIIQKKPALWLLILIAGLTLLSETVYSPTLPNIAQDFYVHASFVEHTLTIYLFGFAIGTLFWGIISDRYGRKPCVLLGLIIFIIGSYGCYASTNILQLMLARLIQSFGGSIGSVLGQAICRDAFKGKELSKAYALISGTIGLFPAIGPIIGGYITEYYHWSFVFIFLIGFALFLLLLSIKNLPETHIPQQKNLRILESLKTILQDKKLLACGYLVGGCNGIIFSYFAESPFYLMSLLELSPTEFGKTFFFIAGSAFIAGIFCRKLAHHIEPLIITLYGIMIVLFSTAIFLAFVSVHFYYSLEKTTLIFITVFSQAINLFGITMITGSILSIALKNYTHCIGTAQSIFGFYYYLLICSFILMMAVIHNCSLTRMPLYFLTISVSMLFVYNKILKK